jgi:response regulator RpfG family c-di-GMP phosphodiesterase
MSEAKIDDKLLSRDSSYSESDSSEFSHCNTLVLVDDEASILNALERLLLEEDYNIVTFTNAEDALDYCLNNLVAVVISDVRMPGMDGIELLSILAEKLPLVERILLTGYSDIDATVAAINKGHVSYYLDKPWDEGQLKRAIAKGIELANIRSRNVYLEQQVSLQNEQLKQWNEKLETRILERTEQLRDTYTMAFQTFSSLIEKRLGKFCANPRDIATLTRQLGVACKLSKPELKDLYLASLFSQAGKISFNDELISLPFLSLTNDQRKEFCRHPSLAEASLAFVQPLGKTALLLRQHRERVDGKGFPEGLKEIDILPAALILGLVLTYLEAKQGLLFERPYTHQETINYLKEDLGKAYPASMIDQALPIFDKWVNQANETSEACIPTHQLKPGMRLARDIYGPNDMLLLARYKKLNAQLIEGLIRVERNLHIELEAFILEAPEN